MHLSFECGERVAQGNCFPAAPELLKARRSPSSFRHSEIREHAFQSVADAHYFSRITAIHSVSERPQMARKFLLKNGDQVAQKLAIVIDAREQLREIDSGGGGGLTRFFMFSLSFAIFDWVRRSISARRMPTSMGLET